MSLNSKKKKKRKKESEENKTKDKMEKWTRRPWSGCRRCRFAPAKIKL